MDNELSSFLEHGYRIDRELGHNRAGGRVTYQATDIRTNGPVVIKQFQFARSGSSWAEFDAHQREVQLLKDLQHPGIPRYLDSFQMGNGFCLVQEYKKALPLSASRSFSSEEIRQIAIAVLEILAYLQNRLPPVIHRDLKPENILIDDQSKVYLVDFGFAHVGEGEIGVSSVVKGTLGFMPPEQLFRRQLTEASDLYGLGMTLICLLTGTKSDQIGDLVDISYRVSFKHLVPRMNARWVGWLEKMVEPRLGDRFPNALTALDAVPKSPLRPPEAQFSTSGLTFQAHQKGETITQSVTITNPVAETILEGRWQLVAHPHDPKADHYQWITVDPATFEANQITCYVTVDTRKLIAGKTYHRTLQLHTNTLNQTYDLALQIQTVALPMRAVEVPYPLLGLLGVFLAIVGWLAGVVTEAMDSMVTAASAAGFGAIAGLVIGLEGSSWIMRSAGWKGGSLAATAAAGAIGFGVLGQALIGHVMGGSMLIAGVVVGMVSGAIAAFALGLVTEELIAQGKERGMAIALTLLSAIFSASFGISLAIGFSQPLFLMLLTISGLSLLATIARQQLQRANLLLSQRKAERYLIKP